MKMWIKKWNNEIRKNENEEMKKIINNNMK